MVFNDRQQSPIHGFVEYGDTIYPIIYWKVSIDYGNTTNKEGSYLPRIQGFSVLVGEDTISLFFYVKISLFHIMFYFSEFYLERKMIFVINARPL